MTDAVYLDLGHPLTRVRRFMAGMAYRAPSGHGFLAGSFPDGITMVEGVPNAALIRVLLRSAPGSTSDGVIVAQVESAPDGTWLVEGLNHNLKYDVVCRHEGYNDMILSNVSPALATGLAFDGSFTSLDDQVEILLGVGPYQIDVVGGTPPLGVTFSAVGDFIVINGTPQNGGEFTFTLRVIDSNGLSGVFASELEVEFDPHWDKVATLLHFDSDFTDQKGGVWEGSATISDGRMNASAGIIQHASTDRLLPLTGDFTIECFIEYEAGSRYGGFIYSHDPNSGGNRGPNLLVLENRALNFSAVGHVDVSTAAGLIPIGVRTHVVAEAGGGEIRLFVNGKKEAAVAYSGTLGVTGAARPTIGRISVAPTDTRFFGFIDEFRITQGVARYTENFTPPTGPFPNRGP